MHFALDPLAQAMHTGNVWLVVWPVAAIAFIGTLVLMLMLLEGAGMRPGSRLTASLPAVFAMGLGTFALCSSVVNDQAARVRAFVAAADYEVRLAGSQVVLVRTTVDTSVVLGQSVEERRESRAAFPRERIGQVEAVLQQTNPDFAIRTEPSITRD
jgi:hypothetical protein